MTSAQTHTRKVLQMTVFGSKQTVAMEFGLEIKEVIRPDCRIFVPQADHLNGTSPPVHIL